MLPAAATRAVRVFGCVCTFAIVFVSMPALLAQNGQTTAPAATGAAAIFAWSKSGVFSFLTGSTR